MKKIILPAAFLLAGFALQAQSSAPDVLASGGGFATGAGFSNSFTIGQGTLAETFTAGTFILTQGFQQPTAGPLGISSAAPSVPLFEVFPNPSNGIFFLDYTLASHAAVTLEIFDALGQRISAEQTSPAAGLQHQQINLSGNAPGLYFVRCTISTAGSSQVKTLRLQLSE